MGLIGMPESYSLTQLMKLAKEAIEDGYSSDAYSYYYEVSKRLIGLENMLPKLAEPGTYNTTKSARGVVQHLLYGLPQSMLSGDDNGY